MAMGILECTVICTPSGMRVNLLGVDGCEQQQAGVKSVQRVSHQSLATKVQPLANASRPTGASDTKLFSCFVSL